MFLCFNNCFSNGDSSGDLTKANRVSGSRARHDNVGANEGDSSKPAHQRAGEAVYRALIDPNAISIWKVPTGMRCHVHAFDARVGGKFRGRFVELVPNKRVVEIDEFETENSGLCGEMRITIADIAGMWQNGGHAGADVVAANNGGLPDFDTGNIGDRIERPGRQDADLQPQVGGAGAYIGSCALGRSERGHQQDRNNEERLIGHGHSIRPNPSQLDRHSAGNNRLPSTGLDEGFILPRDSVAAHAIHRETRECTR